MLLDAFKYGKVCSTFLWDHSTKLDRAFGQLLSCPGVQRLGFVALKACNYAMQRDCYGYTVQCAHVEEGERSWPNLSLTNFHQFYTSR